LPKHAASKRYDTFPLLRATPTTRRSICVAGALLLVGCAGTAPDRRAGAVAELGATGKLRAAINFGNPILASKNADGTPQGVSVDLAREATRRLDLPIELILFNSAGTVVEAVKARQVDWPSLPSTPCAAQTWITPRPT
jgi:polar amino acid transport system substrate-binding protein